VSGDPANHITTSFDETWVGVIDFDVTRPTVSISQARATQLQRPKGAYVVRIAFSARDGTAGSAVSYTIRLTLAASDPVGNETRVVRQLRLRA
jgi:hypothetical protein